MTKSTNVHNIYKLFGGCIYNPEVLYWCISTKCTVCISEY